MIPLFVLLIPLLPLAGFAITAVIGRRLDKQAHIVPVGAVGIAWAMSMVVAFLALTHGAPFNEEAAGFGHVVTGYTWIPAGNFEVQANFYVDGLTACLLIVVTTISRQAVRAST